MRSIKKDVISCSVFPDKSNIICIVRSVKEKCLMYFIFKYEYIKKKMNGKFQR